MTLEISSEMRAWPSRHNEIFYLTKLSVPITITGMYNTCPSVIFSLKRTSLVSAVLDFYLVTTMESLMSEPLTSDTPETFQSKTEIKTDT